MDDAIHITQPGAGQQFVGNTLTIHRINGFKGAGFRIGSAPGGKLERNRYKAMILPMDPKAIGFSTFGRNSQVDIMISSELGPFSTGIHLHPGASGNVFVVPDNDGTPKMVDDSGAGDNVFLAPWK